MLGIKTGYDMKFISKNYPGMAGKTFSDIFKGILDPAKFQEFLKKFDIMNIKKSSEQKKFF